MKRKDSLKEYGKKWVAENLGSEYVEEFEDKYDKLNSGIPIGGLFETMVFLDLVQKIKEAKGGDGK